MSIKTLLRELKNKKNKKKKTTTEPEGDGDNNCGWCAWDNPPKNGYRDWRTTK